MKKTVYSLVASALILTSCSSEPIIVKEGESFAIDGQNITVNLTSASVMTNHEEKSTIIAPEGQMYLKVDVKAEEDTYYLKLKDGETKLEEVGMFTSMPFVEKIDYENMDPNRSSLYLVDASNANYSVQIKSYGDEIATVNVGQMVDGGSGLLNESMLEFASGFNTGTHLFEVVKKYLPEGADVYNYVTEKGMDVPADPLVQGVTIRYVEDKDTYVCGSEFGFEKMTVTWSNNTIQKVVFD